MQKRKYLICSLVSAAVLTGCTGTVPENRIPETSESMVQFVFTETQIPEQEQETDSTEPVITVGHTLFDNTITFHTSVAVIMKNYMKKYDPAKKELTLRSDVGIGDEKYAYVYYTDNFSEFLFQRITGKTRNSDGTTTITLSGIPLKEEMEKEDFNRLIDDYNAYGDTTGGKESEFDENERPFDDFAG